MNSTQSDSTSTDSQPVVIGRCQHCGAQQFDNPNADPALDAMADLCWKCVRPWR